jgi:hypothetical protein
VEPADAHQDSEPLLGAAEHPWHEALRAEYLEAKLSGTEPRKSRSACCTVTSSGWPRRDRVANLRNRRAATDQNSGRHMMALARACCQ